jgi:hypothetical protein
LQADHLYRETPPSKQLFNNALCAFLGGKKAVD